MKLILNTGRTIQQGQNVENKFSAAYRDATACCELSPADLKALGEPSHIEVTTDFGTVTVWARPSERTPQGMVFIPYGPWANMLTNPDTGGCGMPGLKGIPASVQATDNEVKVLRSLWGIGE